MENESEIGRIDNAFKKEFDLRMSGVSENIPASLSGLAEAIAEISTKISQLGKVKRPDSYNVWLTDPSRYITISEDEREQNSRYDDTRINAYRLDLDRYYDFLYLQDRLCVLQATREK